MSEPPTNFQIEPTDSPAPPIESSTEDPWSPPQFGLRSMLGFMVLCAIYFMILKHFGMNVTIPMTLLAMTIWLLRRCYDVVLLSEDSQNDGESPRQLD